jgi:hypothetical protein
MPGFRKMNPAPKIALTRFRRWRAQLLESGKGFARRDRAFSSANVERRCGGRVFRVAV